MAEWGAQRASALSEEVTRFLQGLEDHPPMRRRMAQHGYSDQTHRELQACLARAGGLRALPARRGAGVRGPEHSRTLRRVQGSARAVLGWAAHQARLAAAAANKLPAVAREVRTVAQKAAEEEPVDTVRATWHLVERIRSDEHIGHFVTPGGLRDAGVELRLRLREDGSSQALNARQQAHNELSFLFTRWRRVALQEFAEESALLARLGLK